MAEPCAHPNNIEDIFTNEQLCRDCGELRDLMPWDAWTTLTQYLDDPFATDDDDNSRTSGTNTVTEYQWWIEPFIE